MKRLVMTAAAAALLSTGVQAESLLKNQKPSNFSYNYVDVTYVDMDEPSADGFRFRGSHEIMQNVSVIGSLSLIDDSDFDITMITLGAAYHMPLENQGGNKLDVVAHAEFERIKVDIDGGGDDSESGLLLGVEGRLGLTEQFEAFGDVTLRTAGDNDTLVTLGGRFSFSEQLKGVASYEISDNDVLSLGVRYQY